MSPPEAPGQKKLQGTKKKCVPAQLGQILDKEKQRDLKSHLPLTQSGEQEQGTAHAPCPGHPLRGW